MWAPTHSANPTAMGDPEKSDTKVTNVSVSDALPVDSGSHEDSLVNIRHADDALLAELGYKSEFRREFSVSTFAFHTNPGNGLESNSRILPGSGQLLETIAFGFSIMGVIASVSSTYSFPLVSGAYTPQGRHPTMF